MISINIHSSSLFSYFQFYFVLTGNTGTYRERAIDRENTDNEIKILLNLELPQNGGLNIMGNKKNNLGGQNGTDNLSSNSKNKKIEIDSSIPKVKNLFRTY